MRVFPLIVCSVSVLVAQDFVKDIQPILRKKCAGCHGAAMQSNGLRLDDGAAVIKGGYSGPALKPIALACVHACAGRLAYSRAYPSIVSPGMSRRVAAVISPESQ